MKTLYRLSAAGIVLLLAALTPLAVADATCTALVASKWNQAITHGEWYFFELTIHREDVGFVTYSHGVLTPYAGGNFSGRSDQLFSDRLSASGQRFNTNQADSLILTLDNSALLKIHYVTWNFDTIWDLSCQGSTLSTYVPGIGRVTLTFRELFPAVG